MESLKQESQMGTQLTRGNSHVTDVALVAKSQ
jgi:hypothetical protein